MEIHGNSRILKWRHCTISGHILYGYSMMIFWYSLKHRPEKWALYMIGTSNSGSGNGHWIEDVCVYVYIVIYIYVHTIQYNTIQYTIQYNTIPYSTIQYNTVHYSTLHYITFTYIHYTYRYIYIYILGEQKPWHSGTSPGDSCPTCRGGSMPKLMVWKRTSSLPVGTSKSPTPRWNNGTSPWHN